MDNGDLARLRGMAQRLAGPSGSIVRLAAILAVAATYFGAAKLGLTMAVVAEQVTPVWPPTGIALVAVWIEPRLWPGIAIGAFLANVTAHEPAATACGIAAGNTAEAVLGAWFLRQAGFQSTLARLRDVLALLVLAAGLSTVVSATIGVASLCLGGLQSWSSFWSLWWVWWIGDAMGAIVMAPLLFVWANPPPIRWRPRRVVEAAALVLGLIVVALAVLGHLGTEGLGYPLKYTVFPFVIWGALRFRQAGGVTVTFIASGLALWSAVSGRGPFATGDPNQSLILLQIFMAVVAVTGLLLGAMITERNAAERARAAEYGRLRESEERLRLALAAGHMGVWDWDIRTGDVTWSENLEPIHGLSPGSFEGTLAALQRLIHPEDRELVDRSIRQAVEGGTGYDAEFRTLRPGGGVQWTAGKGRVFRDRAGRAVRMIGVATDVTQRKRLEEELRQGAQNLADADRRKDEFLAMLAHELRNPLAPICNALELLHRRGGESAVVEQARQLMQRQIQQMVRLVDDLLDVSRITSGKIALRKESLELDGVITAAVESTKPIFASRGHELLISLPPDPVRLEADAVRLTQVIANLLNNAAKFTAPNGCVWLSVDRDASEAVIRVRDTGIGMATDVLERAFDLFVQGAPTIDRGEGGLGIGLTLVRTLVGLHGGSVTAESDGPGRGSLFTVRLPALPSAGARADMPADRDPTGAQGDATRRRVLVVDDNVDSAESLTALLGIAGHQVRVAFDGRKAVEIARDFAPDVVLLDIGLPGMDGLAVARALRTDPAVSRSLLIAISGYGQEADRRRTREAGFDHHLVKPVRPDVLRALLDAPPAVIG
jgi:two-component system CheB/CheR fusion protein